MTGKPSAAAVRATKWIIAELAAGRTPAPADVEQRYRLSRRQAQRLCAAADIPALPRGRPRAAEDEGQGG